MRDPGPRDDDTWFDKWGFAGPQAYLDAIAERPALAKARRDRTAEERAEIVAWEGTLALPFTPIQEAGAARAIAEFPAQVPTDADLAEPDIVDAKFIGDRLGISASTVRIWSKRDGFPVPVDEQPRRWRWAEVKRWEEGQPRPTTWVQVLVTNRPDWSDEQAEKIWQMLVRHASAEKSPQEQEEIRVRTAADDARWEGILALHGRKRLSYPGMIPTG